jgi:hypothetical protein
VISDAPAFFAVEAVPGGMLIGDRFGIPYEDVCHVMRFACSAACKDSLFD